MLVDSRAEVVHVQAHRKGLQAATELWGWVPAACMYMAALGVVQTTGIESFPVADLSTSIRAISGCESLSFALAHASPQED